MAKKDSIQTLKNKIEVLKRTRKEFRTGKYAGLCLALRSIDLKYEDQDLWWDMSCVKGYISVSLDYHAYLESWIQKNKPHLNTNKKNMKKYRLQWIDWMIGCLQEDLAAKQNKKG